MINELEIENYESHKKTTLEFVPGLNVFIGESDKGKSGVFRAFRKLITNKPGGNRFFPLYWKGEPVITATFDDCKIIRSVSKNTEKNTYQLDDQDPIGAGTGVPEQIEKAINMGDINFQSQVDRAFLMFDTAGERGRTINKYAGLDKIGSTLTAGKTDVANLKREYQQQKSIAKTKAEQLKVFDDIEDQEQRIIVCEQLEQYISVSKNRAKKLTDLAGQYEEISGKIKEDEKLLESEGLLKSANLALQAFSKSSGRLGRLNDLRRSYDKTEAKIDEFSVLFDAEEKVGVCFKLLERIKRSKKRAETLENLSVGYNKITEKIKLAESEITKLEKKIPKKCFECGSILK